MRIKMLSLSADHRGVRRAGSVHEVSADEAALLIKGGHAVAVKDMRSENAMARKATVEDDETADAAPAKKK